MPNNFHDLLCYISGNKNCYYSPPTNILLKYPCIIYHKIGDKSIYADNKRIKTHTIYKVTIIDEDPDSIIADKISELKYCEMDRQPYVSDNLYHFVYIIYYDGPRIKEVMNNEINMG